MGWNNKQLQDNASSLQIAVETISVTETTWTCDRNAGPQTQGRSNSTTTTVQGLIELVARERNQITGFILAGYDPDNSSAKTEHDGPAIGSCAERWTAINLMEGEPTVTGGGLTVNGIPLQEKPVV